MNSEVWQMINLNKRIEVTSSAYIPQVKCKGSKHYDTKFFITTVGLEVMYLNKYKRRDYQGILNPFKILIL